MNTSEKQLQSHMIKEHFGFIRVNWEFCTICMKYNPKEDLNQQKHICEVSKKSPNKYGCQICPFTCSDKISIKCHLKTYHNFNDKDFKSKNTLKMPPKLMCPSCLFICYDQNVLKAHLNLEVCHLPRNYSEFQTFDFKGNNNQAVIKKPHMKKQIKIYCQYCTFYCFDQDVLRAHLELKVCYQPESDVQTFKYQLAKTSNDIDLDFIDLSLKWLSG